jgi:membrane-bound serine protease (ClpP class)
MHLIMRKNLLMLCIGMMGLLPGLSMAMPDEDSIKVLVYTFDIMKTIAPPVWRSTQKSMDEAVQLKADYILIHMNTYGGIVSDADSIRTKILNCPVPVMVFIDNNAASAGALIAIACDSIYMRRGSSMGAATVVNQSGTPAPDKFQSFMRSVMRATAEAHGKDTIITGRDTLIKWHRDPRIAEAMVSPQIILPGVVDSGEVLTFTTSEAIRYGYCEGEAESIPEVLTKAGIHNYTLREYKPSGIDRIIGFLINPIVSGLLIMLIIGGIYFELQSPGIGFPSIAALAGAILYFAPLYLEGLAENWEVVVFVVGLILLGIEIFAIPGFGITGIAGIILIVTGLTLSLVDNIVFTLDARMAFRILVKSLFIVLVSMVLSFSFSLYFSRKIFTSRKLFANWALSTSQVREKGYISVEKNMLTNMVGKEGSAATVLRPSGKVLIDGEVYDAKSEYGFIEKGEKIRVERELSGQLYVVKA